MADCIWWVWSRVRHQLRSSRRTLSVPGEVTRLQLWCDVQTNTARHPHGVLLFHALRRSHQPAQHRSRGCLQQSHRTLEGELPVHKSAIAKSNCRLLWSIAELESHSGCEIQAGYVGRSTNVSVAPRNGAVRGVH